MKCIVYSLIWMVSLQSLSGAMSAEASVDFLFVFYDAGETFAHLPVLDLIDRDFPEISYEALVMQTAAKVVGNRTRTVSLDSLGIHLPPDPPREIELQQEQIDFVCDYFSPRVALVVGMVSGIQRQLAHAILKRYGGAVKVIGYDDAFSLWVPGSISSTFLGAVTDIEVTAQIVKDGILADVGNRLTKEHLHIVGNPSTDMWKNAYKTEPNLTELRHDLVGADARPIILYSGGYGDDYISAFELFLKACGVLRVKYNIIVALHPKVNGSTEISILERFNMTKFIRIMPKSITTIRVALVSGLIASEASTVGVQALFMGRPTIYLDLAGSEYTNIAIASHLSLMTHTADDFIDAVARIAANGFNFDVDRLEKANIPLNPTQKMLKYLTSLV